MKLFNSNKPKRILPNEYLKKLEVMQARFEGAVSFLKNTVITKDSKNVNLFRLPWYLLIGPKNTGKTTLLANSSVNFVLAKQFKEDVSQIVSSDHCDWWATRDLVLVDVPGTYLFEETKTGHFLWRNFLALIKKFRKRELIKGVVLTVNLPELMKQDTPGKENNLFNSLKKCIEHLKQQFSANVPFYLIVTKCDLLPGFSEFFGDSSSEELAQVWGIPIPPLDKGDKLTDVFLNRFNALIKRLNKQVIWRLHQERNSNARPYIKDFPLHVERLKEVLAILLKTIAGPELNLQGIYLTSAVQSLQQEEQTQLTLAPQHTQSLQLLSRPALPARSFFIKQVISQGLLHVLKLPVTKRKLLTRWDARINYALAALILVFGMSLLGYDFKKSLAQTQLLKKLLVEDQTQLPLDQLPLVKTANLLAQLKTLTESSAQPWYENRVLNFYSHQSQKTAQQIYHQVIQARMIPELQNYLEAYLQDPAHQNPERLYAVLKTYLMLGKRSDLQIDFVINTLIHVMPPNLQQNMLGELTNQCRLALNELPALRLNDQLIETTRKQLAQLSTSELALIILKNMASNNQDSQISFGTRLGEAPILTTKGIVEQIPNMFTARYLQTILTQEIPLAANEAMRGNAVLGNLSFNANPAEETALVQEISKQYIANYVDIWESLLDNIQIIAPANLTEMRVVLSRLTSDHSPLIGLLQTLQQNTPFEPILNASPKLGTLNTLLFNTRNQGNALYQIFVALKELNLSLQKMTASANVGQAAWLVAKQRVQNPEPDAITALRAIAVKMPMPVKGILENLANNSWQLILADTHRYVQAQWESAVYPYYAAIMNKYPLVSDTAEDADLHQLSQLLSPQGALTLFYQNYVKPFVNDAEKEWQWRQVDNQSLLFSAESLADIQYALKWQHVIFPNGDEKLFIPFSLQPISLSKESTAVTLNINGQMVAYHQAEPTVSRLLTWPGTHNLHVASIHFANNHGADDTAYGDWGWFRLVDKALEKNSIGGKELVLKFKQNNHTVKYSLFAQNALNPFILSNWEKLRLPETL